MRPVYKFGSRHPCHYSNRVGHDWMGNESCVLSGWVRKDYRPYINWDFEESKHSDGSLMVLFTMEC